MCALSTAAGHGCVWWSPPRLQGKQQVNNIGKLVDTYSTVRRDCTNKEGWCMVVITEYQLCMIIPRNLWISFSGTIIISTVRAATFPTQITLVLN